ncbi:hypothetical protein AYI68_g559 [Smittium mucronatum]|uniref:Uncharacterized protein n=1 Tax=Smittium mucronatum TaxID=133383 RepID=A0A1R0H804_9FUNG|nr:hypothetical protein AYI68_g559 [Smittium mucronatum]
MGEICQELMNIRYTKKWIPYSITRTAYSNAVKALQPPRALSTILKEELDKFHILLDMNQINDSLTKKGINMEDIKSLRDTLLPCEYRSNIILIQHTIT